MEKIILLGSGGHAKSVVDVIEQGNLFEIAGFLDIPEKQEFSYKNYKVIGVDSDLKKFYNMGIKYGFVTMGYMGKKTPRVKLYQNLKEANFKLPIIKDLSACVAFDATIEEGVFIGKNAVINANAHIGKMSIINTGAIVEHECVIGEYTHIAVGAVLGGGIIIGKETFIGANATVIQGVEIGNCAIVGAGSVVLKNVSDKETVIGNPAHPK